MSTSFPEIHLLTDGSEYNDYRPAIDPTGEVVIFERTPINGGETLLYQITDFTTPNPQPFLPDGPPSQTRPDWCWQTGAVAFNGPSPDNASNTSGNASTSVWTTGAYGAMPNSQGFFYPTWSTDGSQLVAENNSEGAPPRPCNSTFDLNGNVSDTDIDGTDANGTPLYGGMPAAKPNEWPLIAFAGQPMIDGWHRRGTNAYNQGFNYIFLNVDNNGTFTSQPMEPGALHKLKKYDSNYQGRAPAWSPDGSTIAFESNRFDPGYQILLCDVASGTITQVTDPKFGAQHAKFFPCGTKLILSLRQQGGLAIAWVDISSLLPR